MFRAERWKPILLLMLAAAAGTAEQELRSPTVLVTGIRHWSLEGVTRVAVDISGDFEFRTEKLHNPERVFFDILSSRPSFDGKRARHHEVGDPLVSKVRVAETAPGTTRVVLDLTGPVSCTASKMGNPDRLVVELRPAQPEPAPPGVEPAEMRRSAEPPAVVAPPPLAPSARKPTEPAPESARALKPPLEAAQPAKPAPSPAETGTAASRKSDGKNSLIRALGLKINRVVIDPGHGGHDQGTVGKRGLMEKELVLDIAKRVGELMEQQIGCEVTYTRSDDSFVPLEGRTALANDRRADLFISLHANSSRYPRIAGTETFFLNFTNSRDALDVAARENASSQKSVSELQDLLQKIARQEKIEESKELAGRIQAAMFAFSSRYYQGIRNRGVKMAPFVVLVGATMPSVLVEIGFLSNSREETLLKRPDHRQRVAEALVRGITRYTQSLSHFQVAQAKE
jgi:N-acetylmuramoyl-L-alanine amidase